MEYKRFYVAIRRYAKRRITREEFLTDWRDAQRNQNKESEKRDDSKRTVTA